MAHDLAVGAAPTAIALPCCGLANRLRLVFSAAMHAPGGVVVVVTKK